ncbi:metal ABC transporter ATP-binding protein [Seohaeicola sp. SP36]|uniref:metal ABC transporter ATP-binding protein n=1 Tax=unclassified Seohaeicola TaxID=2641111 RepID=UPI00237A673D|nr:MULTISPECIES: metal ABC transporter ATP-binding protein [unclassified Seohaeicola]MDD9706691.1 metal ABC transporter ATP-binding protein [Seohaeicola sp. 4SK31]MDD9734397.1 metal ABC transporter ATP-binding protein [Seohaeicola sp. SP36]
MAHPLSTPRSLLQTEGTVAATPAPPPALQVGGLTVAYGEKPVVFSVDMSVAQGTMTAIVGPNGAGKSTLLKAVLGLVKPLSGEVRLFGLPLSRARDRVAYVPQGASVDWDFPARVIDVVLMGLHRELGLLRRVRPAHLDRARACLARVGMEDFATRQIGQLSGGQQQRVFLARALAQSADLYLLDEPFAGVDAATEKAIIAVLKDLRVEGRTIVAVHHDLSTIRAYFEHMFLINMRAIAAGPVAEVFTAANLQRAYGGRLGEAQVAGMQAGDATP